MINKLNNRDDKKINDKTRPNSNNISNEKKITFIDQKENKKYNNINIKNSPNIKEIKKQLTDFKNNKESFKTKQNLLALKNLKQKESTLINEINTLKNLKKEMGDISYNNISQVKIDNTLHNKKIKNLQNLENNLVDKLSEIKRQINDLSKSENFSPNKNQNGFSQQINTNSNNYKASIDKVQLLELNDMRLMEIQKEYKNKQKELREMDEKNKAEKIKYLISQRQKEIEIIQKRKKDGDEKIKDIKSKVQSPPKEKNYLFHKMEQNFQENEKKLLHKITTERKVKNIFYRQNVDIETINNEFQILKNQLQKRAIDQTNNIKKVWHSRSMIMKKYETNLMKNLKETDEAEAKNEQIMKLTKKGLFLEKELYGKKKVHLPPIDEKLKEESIKNKIDIKNLQGKERINYVNERYMQKGFKIRNINKELDYGKKYVFSKIGKRKKLSEPITLNINNINKLAKSNSSENMKNKNNFKNIIEIYNNENNKLNNNNNNSNDTNKITNNNLINNNNNNINKNMKNINNLNNKLSTSADKIRIRRNPKEINYLIHNKNEQKQKFHKWNKYIVNDKNNDANKIDIEGLQNINKEIETLDEKVNMGNELIKLKGGYENNINLGNKLNNMLIDSIKGKLTIINEIYADKKS